MNRKGDISFPPQSPCYSDSIHMSVFSSAAAFSRVTALAAQRPVHAAFSWLHANPKTILDWQIDVTGISAPFNGERERARWLKERLLEADVSAVETDAAGNVIGILPAAHLPAESTGPVVVLSAHLDTVFPAGTQLRPAIVDDRLEAPGACDNAAGIVGMLGVVYALLQAKVELPAPLVVLGNVGEEGEGDLRGVRHFYEHSPFAERVAAHIVLDGAGAEAAVTQALGSRRYRVTITGPGGHSFTDAGKPNPIAALATALAKLAETPLPETPRTTLNLGTVRGGISVNSIPESAEAAVDFRSTEPSELLRLEVALHRAVEDAVEQWNARSNAIGNGVCGRLAFEIKKIGDRPAAVLAGDSLLLAALRAVDRHLGLRTDLRLGSTDANVPLAIGVPALSMGAGGDGGQAHTLREWYSPLDRELGLKRILLLILAMLEWAAGQ